MSIRCYRPTDLPAILELFRNTVHTINAKDYSPAQLLAWAPEQLDEEKWATMLAENYTIVAESEGIIVGFGDLTSTGLIDHLYVHKDYQSQTFGYKILTALIEEAHRRAMPEITAAVSITALPLVLKLGAKVIREQTITKNGVQLTNVLVQKKL